jgi:predicted kinase
MVKSLFLLRGIPGAGKSTLAKTIGGLHFEADMFFLKDGEYHFDAAKLPAAHSWCLNCTRDSLARGVEKVLVSNTFTQEWEMKNYYDIAKEWGYVVFSLIVENRHDGVNEHNVPDEVLEKMRKRFSVKL